MMPTLGVDARPNGSAVRLFLGCAYHSFGVRATLPSALTHLKLQLHMSFETTLVYSAPLLRQAVFAFWRRSGGPGLVLALAIVALCIGVLVAQGNTSWMLGMLIAVFVLGVAFASALYIVHYRNSLRKFREMGGPEATFLVNDSSFTLSSAIGTTTLQWSAVKEVWQFSSVWLLLYSKAQFSTLPVACLSPEMQAFVLQRVRAAGGKVGG